MSVNPTSSSTSNLQQVLDLLIAEQAQVDAQKAAERAAFEAVPLPTDAAGNLTDPYAAYRQPQKKGS